MLSEDLKILQLTVPKADAFAGDTASEVLNMHQYRKLTLIIQAGANAGTGRMAPEVLACSRYDSATLTSPVTCQVQKGTNGTFGDTLAAPVSVMVSGVNAYSAPANLANTVIVIDVSADAVRAAGVTGGFTPVGVKVKTHELVDATIGGSILAILSDGGPVSSTSGYLVSGLAYRGY